VDSSNISAVGYKPVGGVLYVLFLNGSAYSYADVPKVRFDALLAAESVGKELNSNIKGNYIFTKLF
jgi:hypothetical protein